MFTHFFYYVYVGLFFILFISFVCHSVYVFVSIFIYLCSSFFMQLKSARCTPSGCLLPHMKQVPSGPNAASCCGTPVCVCACLCARLCECVYL